MPTVHEVFLEQEESKEIRVQPDLGVCPEKLDQWVLLAQQDLRVKEAGMDEMVNLVWPAIKEAW